MVVVCGKELQERILERLSRGESLRSIMLDVKRKQLLSDKSWRVKPSW